MKWNWTSWLHSSATPNTKDHVPIWSIRTRNAGTFFCILFALWLVDLGRIGYNSMRQADAPPAGFWKLVDLALVVQEKLGFVGVGAVVLAMLLTLVVTNTGEAAMTLYQAMVNRWVIPVIERHREEGLKKGLQLGKAEGRELGKAEGLEQGIARANDQWAAWNRRRVEAARQGREFNESPPTP